MSSLRKNNNFWAKFSKFLLVELKNGRQLVGKLKAFDIHVNIVLEEAEERDKGELKRQLGIVFVRGDTITIISPA